MAEECIKQYLFQKDYQILKTIKITITSSVFHQTKLAAFTNRALILFSRSGKKIQNYYPWYTIKSVSNKENEITLEFDTTITFLTDSKRLVLELIDSIIQGILSDSELSKLRIQRTIDPTPQTIFSRISEYLYINKIPVSQPFTETMKGILIYNQSNVDLLSFSDPSIYLPIIADFILLVPSIKKLSIPFLNCDTYHRLIPFSHQTSQLESISIDAPSTQSFHTFLTNLTNGPTSTLKSLHFSNSRFSKTELEIVKTFIEVKRATDIGFHNAIHHDGFPYLVQSVLTEQSLLSLSLSSSKHIDLQLIMNSVQSLISLDLSNCGIDISQVLHLLTPSHSIRRLILNQNFCHKVIKKDLPRSIVEISVKNVEWDDGCFEGFLSLVLPQFPSGLSISLDNASMSPEEWANSLLELSRIPIVSLSKLSWNGNPTNMAFLQFLARNSQLEELSLSCCLTVSQPHAIELVCAFLRNSKLKKVCIDGRENKHIGNYLPKLMSSCPSDCIILMRNSGCEDIDGVLSFLETAKNPVIDIDGMMPNNKQYLKILDHVSDDILSFPRHDIAFLIEQGLLGKIIADDIKSKHMKNGQLFIYQEEEMSLADLKMKENLPIVDLTYQQELGSARSNGSASKCKPQPGLYVAKKKATSASVVNAPRAISKISNSPVVAAQVAKSKRSSSPSAAATRFKSKPKKPPKIAPNRKPSPSKMAKAKAEQWIFPALLAPQTDPKVLVQQNRMYSVDRLARAIQRL